MCLGSVLPFKELQVFIVISSGMKPHSKSNNQTLIESRVTDFFNLSRCAHGQTVPVTTLPRAVFRKMCISTDPSQILTNFAVLST